MISQTSKHNLLSTFSTLFLFKTESFYKLYFETIQTLKNTNKCPKWLKVILFAFRYRLFQYVIFNIFSDWKSFRIYFFDYLYFTRMPQELVYSVFTMQFMFYCLLIQIFYNIANTEYAKIPYYILYSNDKNFKTIRKKFIRLTNKIQVISLITCK